MSFSRHEQIYRSDGANDKAGYGPGAALVVLAVGSGRGLPARWPGQALESKTRDCGRRVQAPMSAYPRIASFKDVAAFREHLEALELAIECDDAILPAPESPLAAGLDVDGFHVSNRWVIHPMEGWDGEEDGNVSELVRRRWRNFGRCGAKWIWGGEAMAVLPEARANPRQLIISEHTRDGLARLHEELVAAHEAEYGTSDDLLVGFQLTHSGRFCRPTADGPAPRILYRHPVLDRKFQLADDHPVLGDDEIARIIEHFIGSARICRAMRRALRRRQALPWLSGARIPERLLAPGTLRRIVRKSYPAFCAKS